MQVDAWCLFPAVASPVMTACRIRVHFSLLCVLLLLSRDSTAFEDLVTRLFDLETSGSSVAQLTISSSALPIDVRRRLFSYSLAWDNLSGIMQRALLWDSGFVFTSPVGASSSSTAGDDVTLVQIYTACSEGMDNLLPGIAEIKTFAANSSEGSNCSTRNCGIIGYFLPEDCPVKQILGTRQLWTDRMRWKVFFG